MEYEPAFSQLNHIKNVKSDQVHLSEYYGLEWQELKPPSRTKWTLNKIKLQISYVG